MVWSGRGPAVFPSGQHYAKLTEHHVPFYDLPSRPRIPWGPLRLEDLVDPAAGNKEGDESSSITLEEDYDDIQALRCKIRGKGTDSF